MALEGKAMISLWGYESKNIGLLVNLHVVGL
jgi:hypothetical protein